MEDNEENRNLALQILAMIDQGCMIQLQRFDPPLLDPIGYAEIWLDRDIMFYVSMSDCSTGNQHYLKFKTFKVRSTQVTFYDASGQLVAGLAPFIEWPGDIDLEEAHTAWAQWQVDLKKWARAQCQQQALEYRQLPLDVQ